MKKALLISFYWPPSGKASMHMPLKMAEYLPQFGWQTAVLTSKTDSFTEEDKTFKEWAEKKENVIRTDLFDPFEFYKILIGKSSNEKLSPSAVVSKSDDNFKNRIAQWIRMNLFIPDARIGWYRSAVKGASEYLQNNKINVIISNGPPHTSHLIGRKLSKKFNIPLVTVFIDPWVDISYYKGHKRNSLALKLDNHFEKSVLKYAAKSIFVTNGLVDYFKNKYPFLKGKTDLLYWGYNDSDFQNLQSKQNEDQKILLHAGNLYDHQNPIKFWKYLKKEIDNGRKIKLRFVGSLGPEIRQSLEKLGLIEHSEIAGFLPYNNVLQEIKQADYLLVCASEPRHIPGKLFEYLRTGNPIIAFAENNEDVKKLVVESGCGIYYSYNEGGEKFFDEVQKLAPNIQYAKQFDRKLITQKLAQILDSVLEE